MRHVSRRRARDDPGAQAAARPPLATAAGGQHGATRSALQIFLPPSYSLDGRFEGPTPFIGQLASAPRCAATSLLLRSCTVVLTIKRWDAPRPVSLTRGFKGHTPFIRPVFETASAASCLCHQVRLGLLSGWTMNTWSRFARATPNVVRRDYSRSAPELLFLQAVTACSLDHIRRWLGADTSRFTVG